MDLRSAAREPLPRIVGWAAFGVYSALLVAALVRRLPDDAVLVYLAVGAAFVFGTIALLGPGRVTTVCTALGGVAVASVCWGDPSNIGWFAVALLIGGHVLHGPWVYGIGFTVVTTLMFATQGLFVRHDAGWLPWIAGTAFTALVCGLGRRQQELMVQLREAQAGLARQAQAEERARIARELHDVIAHSLTVSLMHVSSARLALDDEPAVAARALEEAERLGRSSLDEVRHAVGTLHRGDAPDPTAPLPGTTDVPALIESFTAAGADVLATVEADLGAVPATVGLAAYRILQEALTNAAKHAPAARTTVSVALSGGAVQVDVDSAGTPVGGPGGHGLIGMRERAESVGGLLEAGPGGSGWRVHAELPVLPVQGAS